MHVNCLRKKVLSFQDPPLLHPTKILIWFFLFLSPKFLHFILPKLFFIWSSSIFPLITEFHYGTNCKISEFVSVLSNGPWIIVKHSSLESDPFYLHKPFYIVYLLEKSLQIINTFPPLTLLIPINFDTIKPLVWLLVNTIVIIFVKITMY